jgi:alkylated DNA nucleotide flippase Atl1
VCFVQDQFGCLTDNKPTVTRIVSLCVFLLRHFEMLHIMDDVPAHRVVNRGLLTGKFHFDGTNLKQLLESEGIK